VETAREGDDKARDLLMAAASMEAPSVLAESGKLAATAHIVARETATMCEIETKKGPLPKNTGPCSLARYAYPIILREVLRLPDLLDEVRSPWQSEKKEYQADLDAIDQTTDKAVILMSLNCDKFP
jgi:hypothetical protein